MKIVGFQRQVVLHEVPGDPVADLGRPHLWLTDLDAEPGAPVPLSPREWERALSLEDLTERRRFVAHCAFLRRVLAPIAGTPAASLSFADGAYGRLRLDPANRATEDAARSPGFNVSQSENILAVALVFGGEVGLDIEVIRPDEDSVGVARAQISAELAERLRGLPPAEALATFYRHWTRREALAKARGRGIALSPFPAMDPVEGWRLESFELALGGREVAGALAWHFPAESVIS